MIASHGKASDFRPDIEGLRGVAIILVVLYHAGVPGFTGGYVGVDVFFVLSGYLITRILAKELQQNGRLDMIRFYGRRARRLLPALFLVVAATCAVNYFVLSPMEQGETAKAAFSTATYLSNIFFLRRATDYLGGGDESNPLLHTWSLSVEEQFYFVWPLLVAVAMRGGERRLLRAMAIVCVLSLGASIGLTEIRQPWAFFSSPTRAWEFAAGGLAALVPTHRGPRGLAWIGLVGVFAAATLFDGSTPFPGVAAFLPVAATVLVLRGEGTGAKKFLEAGAMQTAGRLSYSWYLWHWPALVFAESLVDDLGLGHRIAVLFASLGLAAASYSLVERPVRFSPLLVRRPARSILMASVLTAAGVGVALGAWKLAQRAQHFPSQVQFVRALADLPALYSNGCRATFHETEVRACISGDPGSRTTVALFGDSHAAMWFPALEKAAHDEGWRLVSLIKAACPAADIAGYHNDSLGRIYRECPVWRDRAIETIRRTRPDIVVMASSSDYVTRLGIQGEAWLSGTMSTAKRLSEYSKVFILLDPPHPPFHATRCLSRNAWRHGWVEEQPCSFVPRPAEEGVRDIERMAARDLAGVGTIDMVKHVCRDMPCKVARDGFIVFRDEGHITAEFAASLAEEFGQLGHMDSDGIAPSDSRP